MTSTQERTLQQRARIIQRIKKPCEHLDFHWKILNPENKLIALWFKVIHGNKGHWLIIKLDDFILDGTIKRIAPNTNLIFFNVIRRLQVLIKNNL